MGRKRQAIVKKDQRSPYWQYDWTIQGDRFRGSTGETDKALAEEIALAIRIKLQEQIRLGTPAEDVEMTLQEAMTKAWTEHFQFLGRGANTTWHHIKSLTRRRKKALLTSKTRLSDIGDEHISDYVARRRIETVGQWRKKGKVQKEGKRVSAATINDELTTLATAIGLARGWFVGRQRIAASDVDVRKHHLDAPKHVHTDLPTRS